jgi:hypothetical protein
LVIEKPCYRVNSHNRWASKKTLAYLPDYLYAEGADVLKYLVGMVLGVTQLYKSFSNFQKFLGERKAKQEINNMINKLSKSTKK